MNQTDQAFELLRAGRQKPAALGRFLLGSKYEPWQALALNLALAREHKRISIKTANGVGKTFTLADIAVLFFMAYAPAIVVSTAGSWTQVRRQLWKEIRRAYGELPANLQWGQINNTDWEIAPDWYAIGLSTNDERLFEGFHERNVLVIVDEAKAVQPGIYDAINRIFAGPSRIVKVIQASSPGMCRGRHYDSFTSAADRWLKMKVNPFEGESYIESRSGKRVIIPSTKHLSADYIEEMKAEYGEASSLYQSMVCAEHSEEALGKFFPQAVLQEMRKPWEPGENETLLERWIGGDVARSHEGDESVLTVVQDIMTPKGLAHEKLGQLCFRTRDEAVYADKTQELAKKWGVRDRCVNIEEDGVGGGVVDILRRRGFRVNACMSGSSKDPAYKADVRDKKAQAWEMASKKGAANLLRGFDDPREMAQLNEPERQYNDRGQIIVESKEAMYKRIKKTDPRRPWKSPDRADSDIWAVYRPVGAAVMYADALVGAFKDDDSEGDKNQPLWGDVDAISF